MSLCHNVWLHVAWHGGGIEGVDAGKNGGFVTENRYEFGGMLDSIEMLEKESRNIAGDIG